MIKTALVTGGDIPFNVRIAERLLFRGYRVAIQAEDARCARRIASTWPEEWRAGCRIVSEKWSEEQTIRTAILGAAEHLGGVGLLIHGNEWIDEPEWFERSPAELEACITQRLRQIFLVSKWTGGHMARRKTGLIVFPLMNDLLGIAGYPSSPILNNAKLAMMKSMAKEFFPFGIGVNAVTFGYGTLEGIEESDPSLKNNETMKARMEIHALKPTAIPAAELFSALDVLLDAPVRSMSGRNLHIGIGPEANM